MRRIEIIMACGALALAFGCDDGEPTIMLMDGGPDMQDSGSATPDGGSTTPDSGGGDTCPPAMAPAPSMPMACEAATLECLMMATTQEAQQACLDADANPDACLGCINEDIFFTCTNGGGCEDAYGEVDCCLAEECSASPTEACIQGALMGACSTVYNAFGMCLNSAQMASACGVTTTCFMSASGGFLPDFGERAFPFQSSYREWLVRQLARDGFGR